MNLSSVDLNLLVVLDALLAENSVTAAAKKVGLSQPAVSNALGRLRDLLGDPLLVREGRGLVPTARARALAIPVRRSLAGLEAALTPEVAFDPKRAHARFVIAMPDIAELVLAPAVTERLRTEAPGIELRIVPPGAAQADLAIAMLDAPGPHASALFTLEFVCLVQARHPRIGRRLSLARFLEEEHVLVAPGGSPGGVVDELLARRGLQRRVALTLAHFFSAALVVSRSDLVMSATSVLARVAERILPVRAVKHPLDTPNVTIGQRWSARHDDDPVHAWLRGVIADVARASVA